MFLDTTKKIPCFDLLSRKQCLKQKSCLQKRLGVSFSWMARAQSFGPLASCCLLHPCSISEHAASCLSYVFWNPAQGSIWMKTPHKTQRWKLHTAYNVFIFRLPSNKASEERQLSGMTKEMNREESMKLSLKNMGWSCALLESNQLGYSFNFILSPSSTFLSKENKTKQNKKSSQFPAYEEASNFPVPEVPPLSRYTVATMYFLQSIWSNLSSWKSNCQVPCEIHFHSDLQKGYFYTHYLFSEQNINLPELEYRGKLCSSLCSKRSFKFLTLSFI